MKDQFYPFAVCIFLLPCQNDLFMRCQIHLSLPSPPLSRWYSQGWWEKRKLQQSNKARLSDFDFIISHLTEICPNLFSWIPYFGKCQLMFSFVDLGHLCGDDVLKFCMQWGFCGNHQNRVRSCKWKYVNRTKNFYKCEKFQGQFKIRRKHMHILKVNRARIANALQYNSSLSGHYDRHEAWDNCLKWPHVHQSSLVVIVEFSKFVNKFQKLSPKKSSIVNLTKLFVLMIRIEEWGS